MLAATELLKDRNCLVVEPPQCCLGCVLWIIVRISGPMHSGAGFLSLHLVSFINPLLLTSLTVPAVDSETGHDSIMVW